MHRNIFYLHTLLHQSYPTALVTMRWGFTNMKYFYFQYFEYIFLIIPTYFYLKFCRNVGINMCVTLWPAPLTEVTSSRKKRWRQTPFTSSQDTVTATWFRSRYFKVQKLHNVALSKTCKWVKGLNTSSCWTHTQRSFHDNLTSWLDLEILEYFELSWVTSVSKVRNKVSPFNLRANTTDKQRIKWNSNSFTLTPLQFVFNHTDICLRTQALSRSFFLKLNCVWKWIFASCDSVSLFKLLGAFVPNRRTSFKTRVSFVPGEVTRRAWTNKQTNKQSSIQVHPCPLDVWQYNLTAHLTELTNTSQGPWR